MQVNKSICKEFYAYNPSDIENTVRTLAEIATKQEFGNPDLMGSTAYTYSDHQTRAKNEQMHQSPPYIQREINSDYDFHMTSRKIMPDGSITIDLLSNACLQKIFENTPQKIKKKLQTLKSSTTNQSLPRQIRQILQTPRAIAGYLIAQERSKKLANALIQKLEGNYQIKSIKLRILENSPIIKVSLESLSKPPIDINIHYERNIPDQLGTDTANKSKVYKSDNGEIAYELGIKNSKLEINTNSTGEEDSSFHEKPLVVILRMARAVQISGEKFPDFIDPKSLKLLENQEMRWDKHNSEHVFEECLHKLFKLFTYEDLNVLKMVKHFNIFGKLFPHLKKNDLDKLVDESIKSETPALKIIDGIKHLTKKSNLLDEEKKSLNYYLNKTSNEIYNSQEHLAKNKTYFYKQIQKSLH